MKSRFFGVLAVLLGTSAFGAEAGKLDLSGTGKVSAEPNVGYITLGITTVNPRSDKALEANANAMVKVYASLAKQGIQKKDIQTVNFSVERRTKEVVEHHGRDSFTSEQVGFEVSNLVRVTVYDLEKFGKILDVIAVDGANYVSGISFGSTKESEYHDEARKLAVKDAARKAKILAEASGVRLGNIISIDESLHRFPIREMGMRTMSVAAAAPTEISGGSLDFTVNVHIVWEILPAWKSDRPPTITPIERPGIPEGRYEPHVLTPNEERERMIRIKKYPVSPVELPEKKHYPEIEELLKPKPVPPDNQAPR